MPQLNSLASRLAGDLTCFARLKQEENPMIGTKSSGSSSDQKDEPKSEQVQQTQKGNGKEIQRPKPGRMPLFRR
jgi:hypothetical protein